MKWNIFNRLNNIEAALAKEPSSELAGLKNELTELRGIVKFQGNVILALQKQIESKEPVEQTTSNAKSRADYKREWYAKNKGKINEQRIINRKIKEAEEEKNHGKSYYWKNRERVLAYGRAYYQRKKAKDKV